MDPQASSSASMRAARQRVARLATQVAPTQVSGGPSSSTTSASRSGASGPPKVTHTADICIIGAGPLGAALAAVLGRKGYSVVIVERDWSEPNRIVGELMQPGGLDTLRDMGLGDTVDGIDAQRVDGYGVFFKGESVPLPYPPENGKAPYGMSFHHGRFVQRLRETALCAPGVTPIEGSVTSTWEKPDGTIIGVNYTDNATKTKARVNAWFTIACDGFASRFRKKLVKTKPIKISTFAALVLTDLDLPFPHYGHVMLADPAPVLAYPISSTEVRMLIDIPNDIKGKDYVTYVKTNVVPQLPKPIAEATVRALETQRLRTMPCSYLPGAPQEYKGGIALGDAYNMRHPLTGAGMSVAFADGLLLCNLLDEAPIHDRAAVSAVLSKFPKLRKSHASTANVLANALHTVFCGGLDDPYVAQMQEACVGYFQSSEFARRGTMSLLGLLDRRPYALVAHFFAVAVYSLVDVLAPLPTPSRFATAFHVLKSATHIIKPLLDNEDVTVLSLIPNFILGVRSSMYDYLAE